MNLFSFLFDNLSYQLITVLAVVFGIWFYYWSIKTYDYFEKKNVPFVKPLPLFGNMLDFILRRRHLLSINEEGYHLFPETKISGMFGFRFPNYLVHDPELIKLICITDADSFLDHANNIDEALDPFMGKNLFFASGNKWKHIRQELSPAFTGNKMRLMFSLLTKYCDGAVKRLVKDTKNEKLEVEMKDFSSRLGNDIIASIALGIEVDSIHDRENEFYSSGKILTQVDGLTGLKMILAFSAPSFMKFFKIKLLSQAISDFYLDVVSKSIKYRLENNFKRPDMIELLLKARKHELKSEISEEKYENAGFATAMESNIGKSSSVMEWTDHDIAAQTTSFFFGGIETTTNLMCFTAYELSMNPDIQERLHKEIDEVNEQLGAEPLTYETIQSMKYLDMVVSETLRKWPPFGSMDRKCTKPYTIENNDGTKVEIRKGDVLVIPIMALQNDPKYYPDPTKFDPERFSDSNKGSINKATYLVFGTGPRNCIGSRLALMQAKAILFHILTSFKFEVSPKLELPLQFNNASLTLSAKNGFWNYLTPRYAAEP